MGESILVLGGARSGKSRLAESLAEERAPVTYLATATVVEDDSEMLARIARHRSDRPPHWSTSEVPRELERAFLDNVTLGGSVVVDCVTLWLTNMMLGLGGGPALEDRAILTALDRAVEAGRRRAQVIWVSNEVGSGIVPADPLTRRFADLQGWANQRLAAACDRVILSVAGLPMRLK